MNNNLKIQRLWNYLRIQDEILAIQVHNTASGSDEFIVADMVNGELKTSVISDISDLAIDKPLRIIRQRDGNGKFEIPSVSELISDKEADY